MKWNEQVVLVTGASRGIGRSIAERFGSLGCKVAINYVSNESKAAEVVASIQAKGGQALAVRANVGVRAEVDAMMAKVVADFGPVSILVNNAGITKDGLAMIMSDEAWLDVINTHLNGSFFCTRAVLRQMIKKRFGRIINIASVSGIRGTAGQMNYSAAKAGMIGMTKALAREVGSKNVTVNAIAPGLIETEMTGILSEEVRKSYLDETPLGRFGSAEEIAGMAVFLAGPDGGFMTGQVLTMDGGLI